MKKVVVSAPGKVILMGEHAVVYGKPAIISSINERLRVAVSPGSAFTIVADEGHEYIRHILGVVCNHYHIADNPPITIEVTSELPIGYHLGSSAALGAALVGALCYFMKQIWNPMLINQLAYESEKYIHKNSSGADPAAVVSGGLIWYRKELDFLRSIWQLPFAPNSSLHHFFLINTGRPQETTGEMVELVRHHVENRPNYMQGLFDQNEVQTKRLTVALKEGNEQELIEAMRIGEQTLEKMGVVSKKVIPIIRQIEKSGGAAKILGGGGKKDGVGFLLCYHHDPAIFNLPVQFIVLGEEGIRLEQRA
jgi:mevalonate kinase